MRYMRPLGTLFTGAHVPIRHTCVGLRRGGRQLRGESPFAPFGAQAAPGPRQLPRRLYCLYKVLVAHERLPAVWWVHWSRSRRCADEPHHVEEDAARRPEHYQATCLPEQPFSGTE